MASDTSGLEVQRRFLHVPIEAVFEALTEPTQILAWGGLSTLIDPRLGGSYEVSRPDGVKDEGRITVMRRPDRLVVAFEGDAVLDLSLSPSLGGTWVDLRATDVGLWGDALEQLEAAFAQPDRW